MQLTSIVAIYSLFWVMSAFLVMPFGVKTHEETGADRVAGQADSAPANFKPRRVVLRASILALVLFAIYYVNYVNGWVMPGDLNIFGEPPEYDDAAARS